MIVGIVGGVASGKSFVARKLAALKQGIVIDADAIAKAKLTDSAVIDALKQKFGADVLGADGQVDRKVIARHVFGTDAKLAENRQWLNELIHPLVRAEINAKIAAEKAKSPHPWIVLDVPLLFESGWDKECDRVVYIDTPRTLRDAYAAKRGWDSVELAKREQSQFSLEEKRSRSSDVLVNNGVESELQTTLVQWLASL